MFSNNLKSCRQELEMTQKELGYVFGVSKYTVHGWENSHDTIPLNKLIKFCNLFDFSLDYVTGLSKTNIKYEKIKTDKKKIGMKLKSIRKELNITQQELASRCGIAQNTYSSYETGRYLINTNNLYSICKTYNISMDLLCGRTKKTE